MANKPGRNDPCPCGSGKKFKRCCLAREAAAPGYTAEERNEALVKLDRFVQRGRASAEGADSFEEFCGRFADRIDELDNDAKTVGRHIHDLWFAFDRPMDDGSLVVDRFLERHGPELSAGERLWLQRMRASTMRLYEVEDALPGESVIVRDLIEGDRVTVRERTASRNLNRYDWVASRVISAGASGRPEFEGLLPIPPFHQEGLRDRLLSEREDYLRICPDEGVDAYYKTMPPVFHDVWVGAILDPHVPRLASTDGEERVITRVLFDVLQRDALQEALNRTEGLDHEEKDDENETWHWSGTNVKGDTVAMGRIDLKGNSLSLEANSVARGERGRALIETAAGASIRHRATTHEDMRRILLESIRSGKPPPGPEPADEIPPEVQEALSVDFHARHLRKWIDEPVPALDGRTPREAAGDKNLRPRLEEILHGIERDYQYSLKKGRPTCDPSWVRDTLGLGEEPAAYPPPLAHERVALLVPGSGEVCRSVAEAARLRPGFRDACSVFTEEDLGGSLELQRLLRQDPAGPTVHTGTGLAPYLDVMVNFHLHRRKVFWVDGSLAYMLSNTDLDVLGRELRVPFPSFALVFTDRHVLALAERLTARERDCPLAGHFLRVVTVFVTEYGTGEEDRTLGICFAVDALGADLPHLLRYRLLLRDDREVESDIDVLAPVPVIEPAIPHANPLRSLLQVVVHAILYCTSAGVAPQARQPPAGATTRGARFSVDAPAASSSEEVYFLPGAIEISMIRRLQELDRVPDGREILRRFMVRGHWRRAAAHWKDQRVRWIQPYWKGPDLAAVIERAYKLKP